MRHAAGSRLCAVRVPVALLALLMQCSGLSVQQPTDARRAHSGPAVARRLLPEDVASGVRRCGHGARRVGARRTGEPATRRGAEISPSGLHRSVFAAAASKNLGGRLTRWLFSSSPTASRPHVDVACRPTPAGAYLLTSSGTRAPRQAAVTAPPQTGVPARRSRSTADKLTR